MSEVQLKVIDYTPDSYGKSIGIQKEDFILKLDAEDLRDVEQLNAWIEFNEGEKIKYLISRGGKELIIEAESKPLGLILREVIYQKEIIKKHVGKQEEATADLQKDTTEMAKDGHDNSLSTETNQSTLKENRYQRDINKAINAINIGSGLSVLNSIFHIIALILLFTFLSQLGVYGIVITVLIGAGLLLSWAITYSLLSLVVTSALTAKHSIIHTSKV